MASILEPQPNAIPVGRMQDTLSSTTHTSSGATAEDVYSTGGTAVPAGTFAVYLKASADNSGVAYVKANGTASASDFDVVLEAGDNSDQIVVTHVTDKELTSLSCITAASGDIVYFTLKG